MSPTSPIFDGDNQALINKEGKSLSQMPSQSFTGLSAALIDGSDAIKDAWKSPPAGSYANDMALVDHLLRT
jgi:hypothetical protein